ncbi:MAG TPA: cupin domain-containing protein [Acidimicrobiales bacterium]|nr:cupin domain-containing protein [Acidimicrobiales bacterium]
MADVRLVVTGHDEAGTALVTSDSEISPVTLSLVPGFESFELWSLTHAPAIPDDTGGPGVAHYFPSAGGAVFRVVTFPPDDAGGPGAGADLGAALAEAQEKVPDLVAKLEPADPGMHSTDTVDFAVVVEGELDLELDEKRTVHVGPGDCVVQRGTRHAWRNRSGQPARVAFILLGGHRAP